LGDDGFASQTRFGARIECGNKTKFRQPLVSRLSRSRAPQSKGGMERSQTHRGIGDRRGRNCPFLHARCGCLPIGTNFNAMKISILFALFNFTGDGGQLRRIKSSTQLFHIERQDFSEFNAKSRLSF
jgi:hypothetical protein